MKVEHDFYNHFLIYLTYTTKCNCTFIVLGSILKENRYTANTKKMRIQGVGDKTQANREGRKQSR